MVSILAVAGCGQSSCAECSNDVAQICETGEHYGIGQDGSFAPYIAIKARAAVRLPKGVSVAAGSVATDAILTAYHAVVGRAQAKKSDTVLLYGLGGLGFNALQILLDIGSRVIVVDKRQAVLDEAVKFGVKPGDVVPATTDNVVEWVRGREGLVIDKVVDFVGAPDSFRTALSCGKSCFFQTRWKPPRRLTDTNSPTRRNRRAHRPAQPQPILPLGRSGAQAAEHPMQLRRDPRRPAGVARPGGARRDPATGGNGEPGGFPAGSGRSACGQDQESDRAGSGGLVVET